MPHNNPHTWAAMWEALPEPIRAAILGTAVAALRILYDGREPRWVRRALEAVLCGAIALAVAYGAAAVGLSEGWGTFLGAAVGLFGADQVREWGRRVAERRVCK